MTSGDRFSTLPRNLIEDIVSLLPLHDAARTSILSKYWRYIWVMRPNLLFDKLFCNKLQTSFKETIDEILLQHVGHISTFSLHLSGVDLFSYADIDRWMRYVTKNGVKNLILDLSNNTTYKLPSHIFNSTILTYLEIHNCLFKPPNSFLGFPNLIDLRMFDITFVPTQEFCVIKLPRLVRLALIYCKGTQYLDIVVSSMLEYLAIRESHCNLNLNQFINCKKLTQLELVVDSPIPADERSTYQKLIFSQPTLKELSFCSFVLELLMSAVTVTKGLPFTLNSLLSGCDRANAIMKSLDRPTCLDRPLDKLTHIIMYNFGGSQVELFFVRLLLAHSPSLVKLIISQWEPLVESEKINITTELMCFPHASPEAHLLYVTDLNKSVY
ncbi:hypothetical protein H5410_059759 [Solanum commersonii]|uniref:F-box domain-containing protein n=1 Tax=Solanum commersonii TaxID=4109 RepID=A0A9J5W3K9_SOLCO|nr:hypothetical protein H5410_059759 [Solanum commersonii]